MANELCLVFDTLYTIYSIHWDFSIKLHSTSKIIIFRLFYLTVITYIEIPKFIVLKFGDYSGGVFTKFATIEIVEVFFSQKIYRLSICYIYPRITLSHKILREW